MNKAVFLDRDGVINKNVLNPINGEYESPHKSSDLELYEWTLRSLKKLYDKGFLLFVVSNQPSFAKGKTSMENINAVHEKLKNEMENNRIFFKEYYYCFHHPESIIEEYRVDCECRKPKHYFLMKAKKDHEIDMNRSWMIGDRDTDIFCGQYAGVRTILVKDEKSIKYQGKSKPDFNAINLEEAAEMILSEGDDK